MRLVVSIGKEEACLPRIPIRLGKQNREPYLCRCKGESDCALLARCNNLAVMRRDRTEETYLRMTLQQVFMPSFGTVEVVMWRECWSRLRCAALALEFASLSPFFSNENVGHIIYHVCVAGEKVGLWFSSIVTSTHQCAIVGVWIFTYVNGATATP